MNKRTSNSPTVPSVVVKPSHKVKQGLILMKNQNNMNIELPI